MKLSKNKMLISAILTAAFFLLSFFIIRQFVSVQCLNDDVYLSIYFSGAFSEKEICVPYINNVLALAMKALYSWLGSGYNLFYIFLVAVEICSFTVIALHIRNGDGKCGSKTEMLLVLILFSIFAFETFKVTTYTKTAGISTAAGMLLLLECTEKDKSEKAGARLKIAVGLALCLTGLMLRFNMAVSVLLLMLTQAIPAVLGEFRRNNAKPLTSAVKLSRLYMPVIVMLICAVFLYSADRLSWSREPYRSWEEFNEARAEVYDYVGMAQYSGAAGEYDRLGLSENDLRMIGNYKISDAEVIGADRMREIAGIAKDKAGKPDIPEKIQNWTKWLFNSSFIKPYGQALLLILAIYIFRGKHDRESILKIAAWFLVFSAETLFLVIKGRYGVERVEISLYLTGFVIISKLIEPKEKISKSAVICAVIAVSTMCARGYIYREMEFYNGVNTPADTAAEDLKRNTALMDSGYLFLDNGISFASMKDIPIRGVPAGMCDRIIPTTSWAVRSPVIMRSLERNGIENAYRDCVGRQDIRIIDNDIETTLNFIREHYCQTAEAVLDEALYEQTGAKTYYITK